MAQILPRWSDCAGFHRVDRRGPTSSVSREIAAIDYVAAVRTPNFLLEIDFTARPEIKLVIHHEQLGFRFRSQFGELSRRSVKGRMILAATRSEDEIEAIGRVHFVNQDVASLAGLDDGLAGGGVARDDNRTPGSINGVTKCLRPRTMANRNSLDRHIRVAVNRPGCGNLMDVHGESLFA